MVQKSVVLWLSMELNADCGGWIFHDAAAIAPNVVFQNSTVSGSVDEPVLKLNRQRFSR